MGGGRQELSDTIDRSVGIEMLVKIGDTVDEGQPLLRQFSLTPDRFHDPLRTSVTLSDHATTGSLIAERMAGECK